MALSHTFIISSLLFCLGLIGIFANRRNLLIVLMCLELILLASSTNFIAFSNFHNNLEGQIFVFFILTVAASEVAIGLAILVILHRKIGHIQLEKIAVSETESEQALSLKHPMKNLQNQTLNP